MMELELTGKKALVCGSTQGIGLGIAQKLAEYGVTVTLLARNENKLKSLINEWGGAHNHLVADFANPNQIAIITKEISQRHFDILINNTGGPEPGMLEHSSWDELETALSMHIRWSHELTKALIPGMKERRFGRILNVISTSVKIPIPGLGVSNTVRGAMASWSKTMSIELGPFGITVNNILPGFISTARLDQIIENQAQKSNATKESVVKNMIRTVPAGRFGTTWEVGELAAFLCSSKGAYLNGVSIPIDGGKTGSI